MNKLRGPAAFLTVFFLASLAAGAQASLIAYSNRADFSADVVAAELERNWAGFNRVKSVRNGGQRSFAGSALDLGDFSLAMVVDDDAQTPRAKRTPDGRVLGLNRITRHPWLRVNKTKFARVKIRDGVDLVLTFDQPIHAFGAAFRGLNNRAADMSISLGGLEPAGEGMAELTGVQIDPQKTGRNRDRTFLGLISDVAFTTITFHGRDLFGMDRLVYAGRKVSTGEDYVGTPATAFGEQHTPGVQQQVALVEPQSEIEDAIPVPVPGTVLLIGLGLLGSTLARRR